jgi:hypothetical protein
MVVTRFPRMMGVLLLEVCVIPRVTSGQEIKVTPQGTVVRGQLWIALGQAS